MATLRAIEAWAAAAAIGVGAAAAVQFRDIDNDPAIQVLVEVPIARIDFSPDAYAAVQQQPLALLSSQAPAIEWRDTAAIPMVTTDRQLSAQPITRRYIDSYLRRGRVRRSQLGSLQLRGMTIIRDVSISLPMMPTARFSANGRVEDVVGGLQAASLWQQGMTGNSVLVGIVDNGFNVDVLKKLLVGCAPMCFSYEETLSDAGQTGIQVGRNPARNTHATMVAYDALIAAPEATLFDRIIGFSPNATIGDAFETYSRLQRDLALYTKPYAGVVLVNSWQVWNPSALSDRDYLTNPNHKMAQQLKALSDIGVDVVFAAGNCGPEAPDLIACGYETDRAIYGANSYPTVLTVGSMNVDRRWQAYSSNGPGRVADAKKPDLLAYADFVGSQIDGADGGTSAAAAVAAGVVAAYRSAHAFNPRVALTSPDEVRKLFRHAVENCYSGGADPPYDPRTGFGGINPGCFLSTVMTTDANVATTAR